MHIVGIIGPYFSGGNLRKIDHNIANAQYVMQAIANRFAESRLVGFFCPHSHTARFNVLAQAPEPYYHMLDETIYDRACDAYVVLPDWKQSTGAQRDYRRARDLGRPVFDLASYRDGDVRKMLTRLERWAHRTNELPGPRMRDPSNC
ncbi:MAG: DUF4406 domain-containing protein [Candidatus Terrybacteria bacterium]|nr:DUF4406 domain-containing protein [Candidatus Terrybacteria bacterium]